MSKRNKIIKVSAESIALMEMRKKANLSIRKLADEMNISFSRVHQMESGKDDVNESYLKRFLEATGFSLEDWQHETGGRDLLSELRSKCHEALDQIDKSKLQLIYSLLTSV